MTMHDTQDLINELKHLSAVIDLTIQTLEDAHEPQQLDFFNQPPQVIIGENGQQLIISINDFERPRLRRNVLIKNEY